MRARALFVTTLGILVLGTTVARAVTSVSGQTIAFASTTSTVGFGEILTATIPSGRAHNVLSIDASLDGYLGPSTYILVFVNEQAFGFVWPSFSADAVCRSGTRPICTVNAPMWVDIDAAEAAQPGMFVGKPIDVDLYVNSGGSNPSYYASLRVRMDSK